MTNAITLAQELLACLQTALLAGPNPPPANKIMLRAGGEVTPLLSTTTDECCTGLGWVRIQSLSGVKQLGDADAVSGCFAQERTLTLELGVARCAPVGDVSTIPGEDEWTAVALQLDADMGAMEQAVCCAFGDLDTDPPSPAIEVAVGSYQPFGVDGNCIGGTMTVALRLDTCCA